MILNLTPHNHQTVLLLFISMQHGFTDHLKTYKEIQKWWMDCFKGWIFFLSYCYLITWNSYC